MHKSGSGAGDERSCKSLLTRACACGEQVAWGSSEWGQCGHESEAVEFSIPRAIKALRGRYVCGVACGAAHTLVLTSTGDVLSCGMGAYGALGHGDRHDARQPRLVQASQPPGPARPGPANLPSAPRRRSDLSRCVPPDMLMLQYTKAANTGRLPSTPCVPPGM
jgi:hypothetical protein